MLLKFNKSISLISVKSIASADLVHYADCIIGIRHIFSSNSISEIYDFCSGNGFPGLIIAILYPNCKVVVVEQDPKKAEFIKGAAQHLKLPNVTVLIRQVDAIQQESVQFAVSRGFASISKSILVARKCFKANGKYFHLKGEEWATEVGSIPTQLCSFWTPTLVAEYKLPVGNMKFAVVCTERSNLK